MDRHPGGARTATAIGYASTTLVGGYTIFPGLGLYIKPQRGDLLFWLTVKNDLECCLDVINANGIVMCDDYNFGHLPDVKKAIDELIIGFYQTCFLQRKIKKMI